jgi:hypothetical protein
VNVRDLFETHQESAISYRWQNFGVPKFSSISCVLSTGLCRNTDTMTHSATDVEALSTVWILPLSLYQYRSQFWDQAYKFQPLLKGWESFYDLSKPKTLKKSKWFENNRIQGDTNAREPVH